MIIDRTQSRWMLGSIAVFAISAVGYVTYAHHAPNGPSGGSVPGLVFGIAAALLMMFAFLLALRRRAPAARLGSAQFWMRGHVWLGALTVPLVLFHSGGRFGGPLEQVLMWTFAVVIVSGIYGLVVQHFLPRLMRLTTPDETFIEQIPYLSRCNILVCDQRVATRCGKLEISEDPLVASFPPLMKHAAGLSKSERDDNKWLDPADPEMRGLLWAMARRAKADRWQKSPGMAMQGEYDFPAALDQIYAFNGQSAQADSPAMKADSAKAPPVVAASVAVEPVAPKPPPVAHVARKLPPPAPEAASDSEPAAAPAVTLPPGISPASAALQAKLAAKKKGEQTPTVAPGEPTAAPSAPESVPASAPVAASATGVSPAVAALQAKLAAKRAAAGQPASAAAEHPPTAIPAEPTPASTPVESPAAAVSPAVAALQTKLAAKKGAATQPAPAAEQPPASSVTDPAAVSENSAAAAPAPKPSESAALQAKLAAKKAAGGATPAGAVVAVKTPAAADGDAPTGKGPVAAKAKPNLPSKPAAAAQESVEIVPQHSLDRLKNFYLTEARKYLAGSPRSSPLAVGENSLRRFALLRGELAAPLHEVLADIERYCDERRQLLHLQRLHRQLHWWLAIHVPVSVVVVVLMLVHIVTALRVIPF